MIKASVCLAVRVLCFQEGGRLAGVGWGGAGGRSGREGGIGERVQVDLPRKIVASRTAKRVLVAPPPPD